LQDVPFTFYVEIISVIVERPWAVAQSVYTWLIRNYRIKFEVLEQQLQH